MYILKIFFLVLARDEKYVEQKVEELHGLGVPFLIVCGQKLDLPNLVYRAPKGKYDAINFGFGLIPSDTDVVALNDVDTRIRNFAAATSLFESKSVDLAFAKISVSGPQNMFYGYLDSIRRWILVAASGELMLLRYNLLKRIVPLRPCKAEDSYILFKALELKSNCVFCQDCGVETERTKTAEKEELYKRKTVSGIYQALTYSDPPYYIKGFYTFLPFLSSLLLLSGKKGYFWNKGIIAGYTDYLRGDRSGTWKTTYME